MHEADARGIRVLIDLVVNHTSDKHPWFLEAKRRDSELHDWYVWSKKRPRNWRSGVVFPGVQQTTWTYDEQAREYYFHRFYDFQPDLNMDNPRVRDEIRRVMGFWLQMGVAGFRVDAVPFILEKPPFPASAPRIHFEYLKEFRDFLQWRVGDAVLLGEANVMPRESQQYFANGDGLHMMFNFWVNQHLWLALASADARPLATALRQTKSIPGASQWAQFLRNHDELDLGRLSAQTASSSSIVSARTPRCASTTAAFAGGPHRCSSTRVSSALPTAWSSRSPARRSFATGTRSAWGRTCG